MAVRARAAAVATTLAAATLIAVSPRWAFGPGAMTAGHARLADDCLGCHAPLRGVPASRCLGCHPIEKIGAARAARPEIARVHALLAADDCLECHSEHGGPHRSAATPRFTHARLPTTVRSNCTACHRARRPDDERHRQAGESCDACHRTEAWKPASVDHARLSAQQACAACHARQRPRDALHAQAGEGCGACHTTSAWRPATFAHEKFFMLDRDHSVACRTCHADPASYKAYTCYGCHAHTPAGMAAEHSEEGIRDLDNCVRCHRSADKHGGRAGGEGRGGHEGRDGEHEHDEDHED